MKALELPKRNVEHNTPDMFPTFDRRQRGNGIGANK